jgi:DNA-binding NarL/FixJ family response regulator
MLSDLNLPQSNGGFTVIEEMRKAQSRCINFILTGYPADESFRRANGHDVAHYFINPVEIEEMVEAIEKKLAAQNPALRVEVNLCLLVHFGGVWEKALQGRNQFLSGSGFRNVSVCEQAGTGSGFTSTHDS